LATQQFGGHWITCDCSFGNNEAFLEQLPKDFYYLGEIACTARSGPKRVRPGGNGTGRLHGRAVLTLKPGLNWQTHKIAEGAKGPLVAASRAFGSM